MGMPSPILFVVFFTNSDTLKQSPISQKYLAGENTMNPYLIVPNFFFKTRFMNYSG